MVNSYVQYLRKFQYRG